MPDWILSLKFKSKQDLIFQDVDNIDETINPIKPDFKLIISMG